MDTGTGPPSTPCHFLCRRQRKNKESCTLHPLQERTCSLFWLSYPTLDLKVMSPKVLAPKTHLKNHESKALFNVSPKYGKIQFAGKESQPSTDSKFTQGFSILNVSQKDTVSFQTSEFNPRKKAKYACLETRCAYIDTRTGKQKKNALLNVEVEEFHRINRTTHTMAQVSMKMDKGIDTFIQPSKQVLRRAEEALMKTWSLGYLESPLDPKMVIPYRKK